MNYNTLWNFLGRIVLVLSTIIFIPFYIKLLGIESYALIGFYSTLISMLSIMDFGLSTTINRELARSKAINETAKNKISLIFTLEVIYWAIGILIAIVLISFSHIISTHWINPKGLSIHTVNNCIQIMAIVIAFQWPVDLYIGGLIGLEKHARQNLITILFTLIRSGGIFDFF